jgi:thioredoxin reductase
MHDAIVIGGGPAGLQAALTLGRTHRDVLLLDSGSYRNDPADAMHNVIAHDGEAPAAFRAAARKDLARYATVTVRDDEALEVEALDGGSPGGEVQDVPAGFAVRTAAGTVTGRRLLLATGVRDELPATPGLQALFGTIAAHCPYCHGHEYTGMPVGVLGADHRTGHLVGLMAPIASRIVVLADGDEPAPEIRAALEERGAAVVREPVVRVEPAALDGGRAGARVVLEGAPDVEVGGLMVPTTVHQSAPFAAQLGLGLRDSGCVAVDAMGRTSRPGVYAAGDLAHTADFPMPVASVLAAAAAGQLAAVALGADLLGPGR